MFITINEMLNTENFEEFRVVAGKLGLENKIRKVGMLDYETKDMIEKNFVKEEFAISTLLSIKDDINELYGIVEKLIFIGVSGLAIKSIYFNNIPDKVVELANDKKFPILFFDNAYFEDIITNTTNIINEKNNNKAIEMKIDNILYSNANSVIIKKIAYEINRNFREKNIVVFCRRKDRQKSLILQTQISSDSDIFHKVIPYKEGYLIIFTFADIDFYKAKKDILRYLETYDFNRDKYIIGISCIHNSLGELDISIKESKYALKYSEIYKNDMTFFNTLGVSKILIPLIDDPWVQKYYNEMIMPLINYDRKNGTELLKTANIYIKNEGNIKATAKEMFQHSNTIRYRIDRVKKVLQKYCEIRHFYEELAVAIRIYNLTNISL